MVAYGPNPAGHLYLEIKFQWHTAMSIHIVYDCFHLQWQFNSGRDRMVHKQKWSFTEEAC